MDPNLKTALSFLLGGLVAIAAGYGIDVANLPTPAECPVCPTCEPSTPSANPETTAGPSVEAEAAVGASGEAADVASDSDAVGE